jgi:hypothetical protein
MILYSKYKKIFFLGLVLGATISYAIILNNEILLGSLSAIFAWYFKTHYDKWTSDRKALARLQRTAALNYNTLLGTKRFLADWATSITTRSYYGSYVEELRIPDEETTDCLRNIDCLNSVVPWTMKMQRYNNDLRHLWEAYESSRDEIFDGKDIEEHWIKLNYLVTTLKDLEEEVNRDLLTTTELIAVLRVAGNKTEDSLFRKISSLTLYSFSKDEIEKEKTKLEDEIIKKELK